MTKISAGTTLTEIVGTEVAPVYKVGQTSGQKFVMPMALIGPNSKTGFLYPDGVTYQAAPLDQNPTYGTAPIEFFNLGYTGHEPSSARHAVPCGIVKANWSMALVHNWKWDEGNNRSQSADVNFPTSVIEAGGEGASLHAAPIGVNWYDGPTLTFLVSGNGPRGIPGFTSGYVIQNLSTIYGHYSSTSYQSGKLRSWNPSTAAEPILFLHAEEVKGTAGTFDVNEYARIEMNASSSSAWPSLNFYKSQGTYASKTAANTNAISGRLAQNVYDGSTYQTTAVILFSTGATVSSGNAGQNIVFQTSNTNTAGLTNRLRVSQTGSLDYWTGSAWSAGVVGQFLRTTATGVPIWSNTITGANNGVALRVEDDATNAILVLDESGGVRRVGFFGVGPVARPVVATGSSTDALITALQSLGLISQS